MSGGQKKKQRTEDQHYVPQFYLRGFTNASGRMFCYDKTADKTHPTSTAAAAQEPYFYEIPPGSFEDATLNVPVNTVEKALSIVDKTWAPLHSALIKSADEGRISATLTIEYAPFLVMQWMRTKTYRDTMHELTQKSMQSLADDLVEVNFPGGSVKVTVGKERLPAMHSQRIFDQEMVERISDDLERHYWVVDINNTEHLFYTSDHPVVRRGNQTQGGRRLVGVRDPGIEFAFPLDSRRISPTGGNMTIGASTFRLPRFGIITASRSCAATSGSSAAMTISTWHAKSVQHTRKSVIPIDPACWSRRHQSFQPVSVKTASRK